MTKQNRWTRNAGVVIVAATVFWMALPIVRAQAVPDAATMLLSKMHATNQLEIRVGHMAQEQAASAEVKRFGQLLERDHGYADGRVTEMAAAMSVRLSPPEPDTPEERAQMQKQQEAVAAMAAAHGQGFDRMFLAFIRAGHEKAVAMVSQGHDRLPESPLKELTGKLVRILQQHLDLAIKLTETEFSSTQ